jgi:signal transduction histidine kinase
MATGLGRPSPIDPDGAAPAADEAVVDPIEALPDGLILVDAAGNVARHNERAVSLGGVPGGVRALSDLAGTPLSPVAAAWERVRATGASVLVDLEVGVGDARRVVECRLTPVARGRTVVGGSCMLRDVTAERRAAEALREAAGRMQQAVWLAGLGIWDWDCRTDRVEWNDEMLRIYGVERAEFTGKGSDHFAFTHEGDRARQIADVRDAFARGFREAELHGARVTSDPKELRIVRRDGTIRHTIGDAVTVLDAAGTPVRMLGVTLDVTERRALEEQVRHSQKMEGIGQIAVGVAHDFNNLLAVIAMCATAIEAQLEPGSPLRDEVSEVHAAAMRGADLTRQLLAFGRKSVVRPSVVDVNALVANVNKMLARVLGEPIELVVSMSPGELAAFVDPGQLEQVLLNYAINARDAMPHGGRLTISTARVPAADKPGDPLPPGDYVRLSVQDEGEGITPEIASRIFEPFFTTKGVGRGTGLGLSTVYGIVTQAGGAISVSSTPGAGARFDTYLPMTTERISMPVVPDTDPPRARGGTVLLVEDDTSVRRSVRRTLERHGYDVIEAASSSVAARTFASIADSVDVLVTDVVMGGLGGRDLARTLRAQKPELPVVFMSAYPSVNAADAVPEQADGAFVQKPFTAPGLLAAIDSVRRR